MKEQLIEKSGAAILDAPVTNAIPPPVRQPRRAPEYPPRKLAASVTRAPLEKAVVSVEVFRTMLQTRCVAPLRLSQELKLVLTNRHDGQGRIVGDS